MGVAIKKIEGVKSVEVSLNQGLARVYLKSGNKVTINNIRNAVETRGFTPREARIKVKGKIIETDGQHELQVTGTQDKFKIKCSGTEGNHEISIEKNGPVVMEGVILPSPEKEAKLVTFEVVC